MQNIAEGCHTALGTDHSNRVYEATSSTPLSQCLPVTIPQSTNPLPSSLASPADAADHSAGIRSDTSPVRPTEERNIGAYNRLTKATDQQHATPITGGRTPNRYQEAEESFSMLQSGHVVSSSAARHAELGKSSLLHPPKDRCVASSVAGMDAKRASSSSLSSEALDSSAPPYRRSCSEPNNLSNLPRLQSHGGDKEASSAEASASSNGQGVGNACASGQARTLISVDCPGALQRSGTQSVPSTPRPAELARDFNSHINPCFNISHLPAEIGGLLSASEAPVQGTVGAVTELAATGGSTGDDAAFRMLPISAPHVPDSGKRA
jgi:hypothetical protein